MSNETEDFLAHYGVKGMKWGVRRTQRQLDNLRYQSDSLKRVSKGKGKLQDKAVAANTLSLLNVAAGRGVKGAAANRAKKIDAQIAKIEAKAARKSEKAKRGRAAAKKASSSNRKVDTIKTMSDAEVIAQVEEWIKQQNL